MDDLAFITSASGLALGIVLGLFTQRSRFCFLSALRNWSNNKRDSLLPSVLIAMATALVASQVLISVFDLDVASSIYLDVTPSFPVLILGSALFSFGMVLANGCPNRHLVLMANGNMRSIVVIIVMGLFSYMTMRGLLAEPRIMLEGLTVIDMPIPSLDGLIADQTGIEEASARFAVCLVIVPLLLFAAWKYRPDTNNYYYYLSSGIIGLAVGVGWLITGYIGFDEFEPMPLQSLTFTVPPGEALIYLMTFTGSTITFGIALVFGVVLGSLLSSLLNRSFLWQGFESTGQMQRSLIGAALMGVGAVMSVGCTIGQGLSGFSTLSLSSLVVVVCIIISSRLMLKRGL